MESRLSSQELLINKYMMFRDLRTPESSLVTSKKDPTSTRPPYVTKC